MERQQVRQGRAQLAAFHDGVDEAVLQRELSGLEAFGQLLLDARP